VPNVYLQDFYRDKLDPCKEGQFEKSGMEKKKSPKANQTSSTRRASNQARYSGFSSFSIQQLLSHYLEYASFIWTHSILSLGAPFAIKTPLPLCPTVSATMVGFLGKMAVNYGG